LMQVLLLNTIFLSINQGITDYFMPVFLKEVGYSATLIGAAATLRTTSLVCVRFMLEPLVKRVGMVPLLLSGVAICVIFMGAIPYAPAVPYVMFASFVAGAGFGMAPVLTSALIATVTGSSERGLGMALDQTASNVGRVTCGFAFGAFAQARGLATTILYGNGLVLTCVAGVAALYLHISRPGRALRAGPRAARSTAE